MSEWKEAAKSLHAALIHNLESVPVEDLPREALMSLTMVASLRNETEAEALVWLQGNPNATDLGGMWHVKL